MNNESTSFLSQVEAVLAPLAEKYTPEGSEVIAVVHQWAHAIANQENLYAIKSNSTEKAAVINVLKNAGLLENVSEFAKHLNSETHYSAQKKKRFRFIDLFAGIGGFRISLQSLGGACVFSSEWDKAAQRTYFNNYHEYPFGDITKITSDEISDDDLNVLIPDHDILAGGFPCQPFSNAGVSARNAVGKEHGFKCNTQGTLFFCTS